jgi:predicted transcriptional regulator
MPERNIGKPHTEPPFKIVIKKVERPFTDDAEENLRWIFKSLGFFEPIDHDKTAFALFKEIYVATDSGTCMTTVQLSKRVGMSRGAVLNHLNKLQRAGLIEKRGRYYFCKSRSMYRTLEEVEEDIERIFAKMKEAAKRIDRQFGIEIRD